MSIAIRNRPSSSVKRAASRSSFPRSLAFPVAEYAANLIKKTVTGSGHAEKAQIAMMVRALLPGSGAQGADAADALAAAITHARIRLGRAIWKPSPALSHYANETDPFIRDAGVRRIAKR